MYICKCAACSSNEYSYSISSFEKQIKRPYFDLYRDKEYLCEPCIQLLENCFVKGLDRGKLPLYINYPFLTKSSRTLLEARFRKGI